MNRKSRNRKSRNRKSRNRKSRNRKSSQAGSERGQAPAVAQPDSSQAADAELAARLEHWRPDLVGTLLFVLDRAAQGERVLLIEKKRGHGAGKINGPGGKLEPGETPLACALRETREEVGIDVADAELRARIRFVETDGPQWFGHIFVAHRFEGQAVETEEAVPAWFAVDRLPFARMWEDDRVWLPAVLRGERLLADFLFTRGRLRAHRLQRVESLG